MFLCKVIWNLYMTCGKKSRHFERNWLLKFVLSRPQISAEHFSQMAKVAGRSCNMKEYTLVLDSLIEEYNDRFNDFEKHNLSLQLAYQPHLVDVNQVPDHFQMELIELSEDGILKSLFNAKKDPIEIWKNAVEYTRLRQHARQMLSCFGTTCCESVFSYMTQIKNRLRSQITDVHLEDQLILKSTMLEPKIASLACDKLPHCSHWMLSNCFCVFLSYLFFLRDKFVYVYCCFKLQPNWFPVIWKAAFDFQKFSHPWASLFDDLVRPLFYMYCIFVVCKFFGCNICFVSSIAKKSALLSSMPFIIF